MVTKVRVITNGKPQLMDIDELAGANVVLKDVPCDLSVYIKSAVRMDALGIAYNALADILSNSNVIGIVESKPTTTTCNIRVLGTSTTIFTGLDVTKEYYLSASVAGGLTVSPPTASGNVRLKIGQPFSATEFLVVKGTRTVRA